MKQNKESWNYNSEIYKANKYISDGLLRLEKTSQVIEELKTIPNDPSKIEIIRIILDHNLSKLKSNDKQVLDLKKNIFILLYKRKLKKSLFKLIHSLNCMHNKDKNLNMNILCDFLIELILVGMQKPTDMRLLPINLSIEIDDFINFIEDNCKVYNYNIKIPENSLLLQELADEEILKRIDKILTMDCTTIYQLKIPDLTINNVIISEQQRYFLGQKTQILSNELGIQKYKMIIRIAEILKELIIEKKYTMIHNIYHHNRDIFNDIKDIKDIVKIITLLIGTYRYNLPILSDYNGFIRGNLIFQYLNQFKDLTLVDVDEGLNEIKIEGYYKQIKEAKFYSNAKAIFLLNNDALMIKLSQTEFWIKFPCILISTSGRAAPHLRFFIKKLVDVFKIPIFAIFDSIPQAIRNLLIFAYADLKTASDTPILAINNIYWLGLMINDIQRYNLSENNLIEMNEKDTEEMNLIMQQAPVLENENLKTYLKSMIELKKEVILTNLLRYNFEEIPNYLLSKINNRDFVRL